jgi:hypothetical protein
MRVFRTNLLRHLPAGRTSIVMDIDCPAAGFAGPAFPFAFHERTDTEFPDRSEVVEHAHVVFCAIAFVELLQPPARETAAVMAVSVLHVLAGRNCAGNVAQSVRCIAAPAMVFLPEIGHADGAVHAAGCDEGGPEWVLCRHTWDYVNGMQKAAPIHLHHTLSSRIYAGCRNREDCVKTEMNTMKAQRVETGTPEGDALGFTRELFSRWLELYAGNCIYLYYIISRIRGEGNTQALIRGWLDRGYDVMIVMPGRLCSIFLRNSVLFPRPNSCLSSMMTG